MGSFLDWLRPSGSKMIPGYMTQLTVTGPYINKTLFDQAGVTGPGDKATWDDWTKAAVDVAKKTNTKFAMAMDRSGHPLAGPSVSMGAKYFDADGKPSLLRDAGHAKAALNVFTDQVTKLDPLTYKLNGYQYNTLLFNSTRDRLTQVITGELSMDDAIQKMQDDIDKGLAEAAKK